MPLLNRRPRGFGRKTRRLASNQGHMSGRYPRLRDRCPRRGITHDVRTAFLEIALETAARPSQPVASAQALASHIDELIRVWPELAHALASLLGTLVWTAPVDQSVPLWRVFLRAREDAA